MTEVGAIGDIVVMEHGQEHALIHHQLMVLIVGEILVKTVTLMNAQVKGGSKKMSLAQNLKLSLPKNHMSEEAVLLTVCSTHEYYEL